MTAAIGPIRSGRRILGKLRDRAAYTFRAAKYGPRDAGKDPSGRGQAALGKWPAKVDEEAVAEDTNPLRHFFQERRTGPGIWKWDHYFDIYDRHFRRFRGTDVHVLEIGVYSGGSLDMWRDYFGPGCSMYGVDIEDACRAYERDGVKIFIGDQADRNFWGAFRAAVPRVDIVIDDGGHEAEQQIVTLEELVPHMRSGGVFLCEDVHRTENPFQRYVAGLARNLNEFNATGNIDDNERRIVAAASMFQMRLDSIHLYPYVAVLERARRERREFVAPKHGTEWEPFLR